MLDPKLHIGFTSDLEGLGWLRRWPRALEPRLGLLRKLPSPVGGAEVWSLGGNMRLGGGMSTERLSEPDELHMRGKVRWCVIKEHEAWHHVRRLGKT